jgi:hypothetical protein
MISGVMLPSFASSIEASRRLQALRRSPLESDAIVVKVSFVGSSLSFDCFSVFWIDSVAPLAHNDDSLLFWIDSVASLVHNDDSLLFWIDLVASLVHNDVRNDTMRERFISKNCTISVSRSGSKTKTFARERRALLMVKLGFSVVAPIKVMSPLSTKGSRASC